MRIEELMTREVVSATPETPLKVAARELAARRISGMPVVDADGVVLGVLSEADILAKEVDGTSHAGVLMRFLEGPPADDRWEARTVGEAMTAPAITVRPAQPVTAAASLLLAEGINRLPVVDDAGRLVGLVTRADLVRAFARDDEAVRDEILAVVRDVLWLDPGDLSVTVSDGIVTLGGTLANDSDVRDVTTFVRRVPGVVEVVSQLQPAAR